MGAVRKERQRTDSVLQVGSTDVAEGETIALGSDDRETSVVVFLQQRLCRTRVSTPDAGQIARTAHRGERGSSPRR